MTSLLLIAVVILEVVNVATQHAFNDGTVPSSATQEHSHHYLPFTVQVRARVRVTVPYRQSQ
jgi:hypothetical protein